jgi:hypothetical protein
VELELEAAMELTAITQYLHLLLQPPVVAVVD